MAATMDLKRLWMKVFPKANPFFEEDGKQWVRYDSIEIELLKDKTEIRFCFGAQSIFYLNVPKADRGDVIRIVDVQGIREVKICES